MSRRLLLATPFLALPVLVLVAAPAAAASFVLSDGEVVAGRLIVATRNTLTVHRDIGGIRQIPIARLQEVRIDSGGGTVAGEIRQVDGTRILVMTPRGRQVWIEGDQIVADTWPEAERSPVRVSEAAPPARAPGPDASGRRAPGNEATERTATREDEARPGTDRTLRSAAAQADTRAGDAKERRAAPDAAETTDVAAAAATDPPDGAVPDERSFGRFVPQAAAAPADRAGEPPGAAPVQTDLPLVRVEVLVPEVKEQAGRVAFRFELSRPSDQPIRLVYSTVDGKATSGEDYESIQGVFTLLPGETTHSIETVVLDDPDRKDPEEFFLFVTTDAQQAAIEEKWHTVTLQGGD